MCYVAMEINQRPLLELRQLTLMHIPIFITEDVQGKFEDLIHQCLDGRCREIVCAVMSTCSWYTATQRERGEQACRNVVIVVYIGHDDQCISSANPHVQAGVIDQGWLHVVELSNFVHALMKGRTRYVEMLFCHQGALLLDSEPWQQLLQTSAAIPGLRDFTEACRGQAFRGLSKKKKKVGSLKVKETTTFAQLCESFRLLEHVENTLNHQPISWDPDKHNLCDVAKRGLDKLTQLVENPEASKQHIFLILQIWHHDIVQRVKGFKFTKPKHIEAAIGSWMMKTRLGGRPLSKLTCLADDYSRLVVFLSDIGGPVARKEPEQIVLVARAGSWMYGLSTPVSDFDYIIVYTERPEVLFSSCRKLPESVENRGPTKHFEYGAYEARLFAEMVLKGSVVILELLFVDGHDYESPAWKALAACKSWFLTERTKQQYLGLVKNNFNLIHTEKHGRGTAKDRKLFYQVFHKLHSLEYFLQELPPPVRCTGDIRDFILRVRTQPWEGDMSRENLYTLAKQKYDAVKQELVNRQKRLAENINFKLMSNWLLAVRDIPLDKEEC